MRLAKQFVLLFLCYGACSIVAMHYHSLFASIGALVAFIACCFVIVGGD